MLDNITNNQTKALFVLPKNNVCIIFVILSNDKVITELLWSIKGVQV